MCESGFSGPAARFSAPRVGFSAQSSAVLKLLQNIYSSRRMTLVFRRVHTQVFQLIWIHGVQEFVLCVLGDMHGALSVCIWRMLVSPSG